MNEFEKHKITFDEFSQRVPDGYDGALANVL